MKERTKSNLISVPQIQGLRGAGLGNEVIPWAKAYIASQEIGARVLHPPWALNARKYRLDFSSSRFDWISYQTLRALPAIEISRGVQSQYEDYAEAARSVRHKARAKRGPCVIWNTSGMDGGYLGIADSAPYLKHQLFARDHVTDDLYQFSKAVNPSKLLVAIHVRTGDFDKAGRDVGPGEFNKILPLGWYRSILKTLTTHFGNRVEFVLFTDNEEDPRLAALLAEFSFIQKPERRRPLLSDLKIMSSCDLLVCAVSSLSMLAGFLSDRPYVWYEPHLWQNGGFQSIWGYEDSQRSGATARNQQLLQGSPPELLTRGWPISGSGEFTESQLDWLASRLNMADRRSDLLLYGVTPHRLPS